MSGRSHGDLVSAYMHNARMSAEDAAEGGAQIVLADVSAVTALLDAHVKRGSSSGSKQPSRTLSAAALTNPTGALTHATSFDSAPVSRRTSYGSDRECSSGRNSAPPHLHHDHAISQVTPAAGSAPGSSAHPRAQASAPRSARTSDGCPEPVPLQRSGGSGSAGAPAAAAAAATPTPPLSPTHLPDSVEALLKRLLSHGWAQEDLAASLLAAASANNPAKPSAPAPPQPAPQPAPLPRPQPKAQAPPPRWGMGPPPPPPPRTLRPTVSLPSTRGPQSHASTHLHQQASAAGHAAAMAAVNQHEAQMQQLFYQAYGAKRAPQPVYCGAAPPDDRRVQNQMAAAMLGGTWVPPTF